MGYVWVDEQAAAAEAVRIARDRAEEVAVALRNELVARSPRGSGRLANSWGIDTIISGLTVRCEVYSNVQPESTDKYLWQLHHEGTGRHGPRGRDIVPVRRLALRWRGGRGVASPRGAGYVFAKRSQGIRPNPFIVDAIAAVRAKYPDWDVEIRSTPGSPTS